MSKKNEAPKEDTRELVLDGQIAIDKINAKIKEYNEANPELRQKEYVDEKWLTEKMGANNQILRVWRNERTPNWLGFLVVMMEEAGCGLMDLVIDRRPKEESKP